MDLLQVPFRDDFVFIPEWMVVTLYLAFAISFVAFVYGIYIRSRPVGFRDLVNVYLHNVWDNVKFTVNQWLLQRRLMMKRYPGSMHWGIFFGALILLIGTVLVFVNQDFLKPLGIQIMRGDFYVGFKVVLDAFGLVFLAGIFLALWRRVVLKPKYLENRRWDYTIVAGLFYMGLTGFILEGLRLSLKPVPWGMWSFVGIRFASLFSAINMSTDFGIPLYQSLWLSHAAVALTLAISLPHSTLFHIILSSANVLKTRIKPIGRIDMPFNLVEMTKTGNFDVKVGFNTVQELTWDRRLMLTACTDCGRCQAACPATAAGRALNPRLVIQHLGAQTKEAVGGWSKDVFEGRITAEEVWGCTTCGACVQQCPILIRKPDFLIDLRRYLIANGKAD